MSNLIKKIQTDNSFSRAWRPDSRLVLGISGGPDSACLLDVFAELSRKYPLELHLAHVNYGLRGADSLKDEQFVEKLAERYGLPLTVLLAEKLKPEASESDLRQIRYAFLEELRNRLGFDLIAVAHSLDDQAETVLHRLIRGSGLKGLSAMSTKNRRIVRPLLGISREEILAHLKSRKLKYRTDKSNLTGRYLRNRIRLQLLPFLEKRFNPNMRRTLAANAAILSDDDSFLDSLASGYFKRGYAESRRKILSLAPALQRRVLLRALAAKKGDGMDIESRQIHELLKALHSHKNKEKNIAFSGLKITFRGDKIAIR